MQDSLYAKCWNKTKAEANVACPHRSTSTAGVIQRRSTMLSRRTKKAVSERLFSAAICCSRPSGSHSSSTQTPAGFPPKVCEVKALTWKYGMRIQYSSIFTTFEGEGQ